jgi:hypothetical protein
VGQAHRSEVQSSYTNKCTVAEAKHWFPKVSVTLSVSSVMNVYLNMFKVTLHKSRKLYETRVELSMLEEANIY